MNFYDTLRKYLIDNGMFDSQADAVMQIAVKDDSFSNMNGRWNDDASGYQNGFTNILTALLRPIAYRWICDNAPQAWFRAVFSPGVAGLKDNELNQYLDRYMTKQRAEAA